MPQTTANYIKGHHCFNECCTKRLQNGVIRAMKKMHTHNILAVLLNSKFYVNCFMGVRKWCTRSVYCMSIKKI